METRNSDLKDVPPGVLQKSAEDVEGKGVVRRVFFKRVRKRLKRKDLTCHHFWKRVK
jgi:hypothetical protein